jgi:hypothetical protein
MKMFSRQHYVPAFNDANSSIMTWMPAFGSSTKYYKPFLPFYYGSFMQLRPETLKIDETKESQHTIPTESGIDLEHEKQDNASHLDSNTSRDTGEVLQGQGKTCTY